MPADLGFGVVPHLPKRDVHCFRTRLGIAREHQVKFVCDCVDLLEQGDRCGDKGTRWISPAIFVSLAARIGEANDEVVVE